MSDGTLPPTYLHSEKSDGTSVYIYAEAGPRREMPYTHTYMRIHTYTKNSSFFLSTHHLLSCRINSGIRVPWLIAVGFSDLCFSPPFSGLRQAIVPKKFYINTSESKSTLALTVMTRQRVTVCSPSQRKFLLYPKKYPKYYKMLEHNIFLISKHFKKNIGPPKS